MMAALAALWALQGCATDDLPSEGSYDSPVSLGSETVVSYEGSVGPEGSFYTVSVTDTNPYTVSLTDLTDDVHLFCYGTGEFFDGAILDSSVNSDTMSETCLVTMGGAILYLYVHPIVTSGSEYTINVN